MTNTNKEQLNYLSCVLRPTSHLCDYEGFAIEKRKLLRGKL